MSAAVVVIVKTADYLDTLLSTMNEAGDIPSVPFVDAGGVSSVAWGQAPSGDDWAVGFPVQDADSGMEHCCTCSHEGQSCDAGSDWEPKYPLTALVLSGYAGTLS